MHTQLKLDYLPDAWVSFAETLGFFLPDIYRLLEQYSKTSLHALVQYFIFGPLTTEKLVYILCFIFFFCPFPDQKRFSSKMGHMGRKPN